MPHSQSDFPPEPPGTKPETTSLADVRAAVAALQEEHANKGIALSGRVIHACHYLPIVATLGKKVVASTTPNVDVLPSPPRTPEQEAAQLAMTPKTIDADLVAAEAATPKWQLNPRRGHTALVSGIRSLTTTHEQIMVGWPGDIEIGSGSASVGRGHAGDFIRASSLTDEDKSELETAIRNFVPPPENHNASEPATTSKGVSYVPVWMDDDVAHGHYEGYCKTTLWPLFHYLLWQDVATEMPPEDLAWTAYEKANMEYAKRIAAVHRPGDLVWVQDYHLLLVPRFLRQLVPDAHIGLFIHTPFPSSEVFRCLPKRKEILDGILGANLVCFQTYSYSRHFASSCVRVCGYESAAGPGLGIDVAGHVVAIMHCAVGVDAMRVGRDTLRPGIQPKLQTLRTLYEGKKIIVGRDKLDAVKGVLQKLHAFEKFLRDYPQWRGNVVMIQVTSPSLTDAPKLERQVSELVGRINGEFGALDFIPVHHYHQTIKKDDFYALLSVADLALITPLRDGMNTTSMEFVICQEKTNKSPLVLSEFMGISNTMADALQINPWNLGEVAAAIHKGLLMSEEEKLQRQAALYKVVTTHTSHTWAAMLVRNLLLQIGNENTAHQTAYLDRDLLRERYARANRRLLLFDYDGTLTPIVRVPSAAVPSEPTLEALKKLSADPKNLVYIISGRDGGFLEQHLGFLSNIGFSAEHGCFVREPGSTTWTNLAKHLDMSWLSEVEEIFKYYTERTTGSFIEMKKSSITWHYRSSDPDWGSFQCKQCLDLLETNLAPKRPIEVLVGKKNLEVRPLAINKGEIVKRVLYNNPDAEFVFCAGDDKTDEDMFRSLRAIVPSGSSTPTLNPPISANLTSNGNTLNRPVDLALTSKDVFSTTVGSSSKRTLASWHVTSPAEIVESMLGLVNET